jgi:ATP citrate (pro-S)-lyase
LVVKPDQLIKRRGKLGLLKANVDLEDVKAWVAERINKEIEVRCELVVLKLSCTIRPATIDDL